MIKATFTPATDNLKRLERITRSLPDIVTDTIGPRIVPRAERLTSQWLRRDPGPVKKPIEWTSEKQRAYYFGFVAPRDANGKIMAYQRTGGMMGGWFVVLDVHGDSVTIGIVNNQPASQYVYGDEKGDHHQQFHVNTGWPNFAQVFIEMQQVLVLETDHLIDDVWAELFR